MANITGTKGNDYLKGTAGDDTILGLDGNDKIIGSTGLDNVDGGAGNDKIDFSSINKPLFLSLSASSLSDARPSEQSSVPPAGLTFLSILSNVETIVGNPNQSSSLYESSRFPTRRGIDRYEVDLSKNQIVTYFTAPNTAPKIVTIKNFDNINVRFGKNKFTGNNRNNIINGGFSDNIIVGSKGNDTLTSGGGNNTLDYSNLGRVVTVSLVTKNVNFTVDKSGFGTDKISGFSKIIGANNKKNTIDLSSAAYGNNLDVNLAKNSMNIITPSDGVYGTFTAKYEVVNFVNVIGGKYNDNIVGSNKKSTLTGGGGNDKITGGNQNDIITGTDSTSKGVGEVDTLTGGGGKDKFVLGDKNGVYYVGNGANDYALITDFNLFQDSISIGSLKNYSFALAGNNSIDLYSGKDVKTRDLIAKIQIAGGISSVASNAKSAMSPDASLNALVGKINIISG